MSVKYTCRNCGNVWHGSTVGRVAKGTFSLLGIIAVAASGRGSYIDVAKLINQCPRQTIGNTEFGRLAPPLVQNLFGHSSCQPFGEARGGRVRR